MKLLQSVILQQTNISDLYTRSRHRILSTNIIIMNESGQIMKRINNLDKSTTIIHNYMINNYSAMYTAHIKC
jgi:hypothetical protein